uniref:Chromate transporter n=1 Tax=Cyanothece sp. (strain PCC 7425 / ATCC 29141) TaxID=395961 RepID=B8HPE2_CYAP4
MDNLKTLLEIFWSFLQVSLTSLGGGGAILLESQRQAVTLHHWVTPSEFNEAVTLGQLMPGSSGGLGVVVIGYQAGGWLGGIIAAIGLYLPAAILTGLVTHLSQRWQHSSWMGALQQAIVPISLGLLVVMAGLFSKTAIRHWQEGGLVLIVALAYWRWHLNPILIILATAWIGFWLPFAASP